MPRPIIPHELLDPDCDGCINEVIEESGSRYFCNVRKAEIHFEDIGHRGDGDAIG